MHLCPTWCATVGAFDRVGGWQRPLDVLRAGYAAASTESALFRSSEPMTSQPVKLPSRDVSEKIARLSISPRAHNIVSYAGAALMMGFLAEFDASQRGMASGLWVFHFLRRTVESIWVHRYSGRPIPPADYLVEYLYYWGFGAWVATSLASSSYEATSLPLFFTGFALFAVGQVGNTWAHQKLRKLRPARGLKTRSLPEGGLFSLVACPHYLFEIVTWAGFALLCGTWAAVVFLAVGTVILTGYALSRRAAYLSEFDGKNGRPLYPASRRALIPFLF